SGRVVAVGLVAGGVVIGRKEDLAGGFEPVLGEAGLQARDQRALDAEHGVAPGRVYLLAVEPGLADAGAADEPRRAVDDEELPVRAVGEVLERVPARRLVPDDLAAGVAERGERAVGCREAAHPVEDEPDLHAGAGALDERVEEAPAHRVGAEDELLEVDAGARAGDRRDLRVVEIGGARHRRDAAAAVDLCVGDAGEESQERGSIEQDRAGGAALDPVVEPELEEDEKDQKPHNYAGNEREDGPEHATGVLSAPRQRPGATAEIGEPDA